MPSPLDSDGGQATFDERPAVCDDESTRRGRSHTAAMISLLLATALSGSASLTEVSFEDRVERAQRVEASAYGKAYVDSMWKQIGAVSASAMRECFERGSPPDTAAFVLVANVRPDGSLAALDIRPNTAMAACYAERFAAASFPTPPEIFGDAGIPIVVEMRIKP